MGDHMQPFGGAHLFCRPLLLRRLVEQRDMGRVREGLEQASRSPLFRAISLVSSTVGVFVNNFQASSQLPPTTCVSLVHLGYESQQTHCDDHDVLPFSMCTRARDVVHLQEAARVSTHPADVPTPGMLSSALTAKPKY